MASAELSDVAHWYGGDLIASNTGDLARVVRSDRSRQRVLRRLMTADGDYIMHPEYGAGLPGEVGVNLELARVKGLIRGEMQKEASVQQTPIPEVGVAPIANGVRADISYMVAPEASPAILSFDVSE